MLRICSVDGIFTDVFKSFTSEFSWTSLFILLTGIVLGFIISVCLYLVIFLASLKKTKDTEIKELSYENEVLLKEKLSEIKKDFITDTEGLSMKEKTDMFGNALYNVANTVASNYYPNSKYPLYELSIEELIHLLNYLSNRIDGIFSKPVLKMFRKMTISQIFRIIDTKKKIEENKLVKVATSSKTKKIFQSIMTVINYANPIYWIKKVVINTSLTFTLNRIFLLVLDIVSDETNKAYSKSLFNEERVLNEKEINAALSEIENEM